MDIEHALGTYLELADAVAPGVVEGLYVVGSYALGDWHEDRSDVDIVAVGAEPATEEDGAQIRLLHALLQERQPRPHVDGPYLAWGDLVVAPATGLYRPWSLDGIAHHDGECFEINPVTWYVLATYGVTVRGPQPAELGIVTDTEERVRFCADNLQDYWITLADQIDAALAADPARHVEPSMIEWCALGPLRLHYTAFTGDVTSKRAAGEYGLTITPAPLHEVIETALRHRGGGQPAVDATTLAAAGNVIRWCVGEVIAAR